MGRALGSSGYVLSTEDFRKPRVSETVLVSLAAPSLGYKESADVSIYSKDLEPDFEVVLQEVMTLIEVTKDAQARGFGEASAGFDKGKEDKMPADDEVRETDLGARMKC